MTTKALLLRARLRRRATLEPATVMVGPESAWDDAGQTSTVAARSDPYATLAATLDPVEGDEIGVEPD